MVTLLIIISKCVLPCNWECIWGAYNISLMPVKPNLFKYDSFTNTFDHAKSTFFFKSWSKFDYFFLQQEIL